MKVSTEVVEAYLIVLLPLCLGRDLLQQIPAVSFAMFVKIGLIVMGCA